MVRRIAGAIGDDLLNEWREVHGDFYFNDSQMIRFAIAASAGYTDDEARRIAMSKPKKPIPSRDKITENA